MVDDRGEVGGAIEAHRLETLVVGLHHALDAAAVRVLWVSVLNRNTKKTQTAVKVAHVKTYRQHTFKLGLSVGLFCKPEKQKC